MSQKKPKNKVIKLLFYTAIGLLVFSFPMIYHDIHLIKYYNNSVIKGTINGKVEQVIDGSTMVLRGDKNSYKIELKGIKTPKLNQDFGLEAKEFLEAFLKDKDVRFDILVILQDEVLSGFLYVNDYNVNKLLVEKGYAVVLIGHFCDEKKQEFLNAEREAKMREIGIWKKKPKWYI